MTDTYIGGYKQAILDVANALENLDGIPGAKNSFMKTKKQYIKATKSLLNLLLTNASFRERFMYYGFYRSQIKQKSDGELFIDSNPLKW